VALRGLYLLFSGKPVHPVGDDGRMALSDHFRELRARVLKVALTFLVVFVVSLFFFDQLFDFVYGPYETALKNLPEGTKSLASTSGAGGGLMLYLKLCGFTAVLITCPVWLYQIWAFIMPGLHPSEKRWTQIFVVIAVPLFLVGVVLGWLTLPKGLEVLIGFNPDVITNIIDFNDYLQFFTRTLLVFGLAFEIPVFVVMLNRAGVVKGKTLAQYRPWIIVGIFVFAAIATPSTDPFTMTIMAVPMVVLYLMSEVIARVHDRRKAEGRPNAGLSPDEMSPL
jgi:sec-independent protein translocase protein TatC